MPITAKMPAIIKRIVYVSILIYLVNLMPTVNNATEKIAPITKVTKFTLPENPGIKNPMTDAPNSTLPKSRISLDSASTLPDDIMIRF